MKGFLPSALKWYELTVVKASGGTLGSSSRSRSRRSIVSKQAEKNVAVSTGNWHCAEVTLPPSNTVRWVASRKTMVLAAIDAGSLSIEEACLRYRLSIEEIASWSRLTELHGRDGLKTSKLEKYRKEERAGAGRSLS
jgi:hypothetical protein